MKAEEGVEEDDSEASDKDHESHILKNAEEFQVDTCDNKQDEATNKMRVYLPQTSSQDEAETSTPAVAEANLDQVLEISELDKSLILACEELLGEAKAEEEYADEPSSRQARRMHKKTVKAERRAQRECAPGAADAKRKPCEDCGRLVDLLVRCTRDSSQQWCMLCGRCWKSASGGIPDGDADHPHYRYGGIWKNRSADLSTPNFNCKPKVSPNANVSNHLLH